MFIILFDGKGAIVYWKKVNYKITWKSKKKVLIANSLYKQDFDTNN